MVRMPGNAAGTHVPPPPPSVRLTERGIRKAKLMHLVEARHLFPGATVLDGVTPRRIAFLRTTPAPGRPSTRIVFEPHDRHRPGRAFVCRPDDELLLSVEHKVSWTIHHRHRSERAGRGQGPVHTARISNTGAVAGHWAYRTDHEIVTRLVEEHTVITTTPITLEQLPGPGQPTEAAPEHGARFYHLYRGGPSVLRTGDDVRRQLGHLQSIHDRDHRPQWTPELQHNPDIYQCAQCAPGAYDLMPLVVLIERAFGDLALEQLPDYEYELGPEAAFARIKAAG